MSDIFLKLVNMSISASYLVLAVLLIRLVFPQMPKWISCLLWGVVAARLLLPIDWQSTFSLIPSAEVIPPDIAVSETPAINSGIPAVNSAVNPVLAMKQLRGELMLDKLQLAATKIWLAGAVLLLLYSVVSYFILRWRVRVFVSPEKGVRICDYINTPFVFGILFPRIYLPSGMPEADKIYVLAHERAHIKRKDHCWKPLGFLLLTVYWFNPILWVAYILLCRDIEQACDEKVVAQLDHSGKKGYAQALLSCSTHRRMIMACPVAFGEVGVKSRIKAVARYKRASVWIIGVSVAVCAATVVCFASDPVACQHSYRSEITVASTCTERGLQINTCQLCRYSYGQPAALLPHSYDTGTVTMAATCTQSGMRTLHCTGCGAYQNENIAPTGHDLGTPYGIKEPDCTHEGEKIATCQRCQQVLVTEILPVNDAHDLEERVIRYATCAEAGEGVWECSRCDYSESCSYPVKSHTLTETVSPGASCTMPGWITVTCADCDYKEVRIGGISGHRMKDYGDCRKCTVCGFVTGTDDNPMGIPTGSTTSVPTFPVIQWDPVPSPIPDYPSVPGWP